MSSAAGDYAKGVGSMHQLYCREQSNCAETAQIPRTQHADVVVPQIQEQTLEVVKAHSTGPGVDLQRGGSSTESMTDSSRDVQMQVRTVQAVQQTRHPQAQFNNTVTDIPVVQQRQVPITSENGRLSQTETDHLTQEAEEYRDEDKLDTLEIEAKNGLKNNCVTMRNTSIVEQLKSKFELEHNKNTQQVVHARNRSDKNRWIVQKTVEDRREERSRACPRASWSSDPQRDARRNQSGNCGQKTGQDGARTGRSR